MEIIPIYRALLFNIMLLCFVIGLMVGLIIDYYLKLLRKSKGVANGR